MGGVETVGDTIAEIVGEDTAVLVGEGVAVPVGTNNTPFGDEVDPERTVTVEPLPTDEPQSIKACANCESICIVS